MISPLSHDYQSMQVQLRYLGRLGELHPDETVWLPAEISDVAALRAWLSARGAAWQAALAPERGVRVAVNHAVAGAETRLQPGDEIAWLPPFTGG